MARTINDIIEDMQHSEERIMAADVAVTTLLELSGVALEVQEAIGKLIEVRSEAAHRLEGLVEEFQSVHGSDIIVYEVVAVGVEAL